MADQTIVEYIKRGISQGFSLDQIKQTLRNSGWSEKDVEKGVSAATSETKPSRPKASSKALWIIPIVAVILVIAAVFGFVMFSQQQDSGAEEQLQQPEEIERPGDSQDEMSPDGQLEEKEGTGIQQYSGPLTACRDFNCFIEESRDCSPANFTHRPSVGIFGINQTTTSYLEIRGEEEGRCVLYIRTEEVELEFTEPLVEQMLNSGLTEEQVEQQEQESREQAKMSEGREGLCRFETEDITSMLTRWKDGNFSTEDYEVAECEGSMFENA